MINVCQEVDIMLNQKRVIGLTGGIGSGKSMVLDIFKTEFDAEVIEADKVGHMIMEPDTEGYERIVDAFGKGILVENCDGNRCPIDRKKLGDIVFSRKESLGILNGITHPLIHRTIAEIIENSPKKLVILEAAILTETTLKDLCHEIWYIYAREDVRLSRLETYRGMSREKARAVMKNQPSEEEFRKKCHVLIDNSDDKSKTLLQIKDKLQGGTLWEQ